ncbi:PREDICTED: acidic endochitinase SP2-like [Polistes dominula]|uniref:Acidic endochitinase SP2-like n=1 Tax=Polistes dominula TaxID=743375 RepID=A0ABM1JBZ9_POLDO|nr:PREDICTED: acidic endochitinase SP2-like [Polistes dominula]XP_015189987.1 PREDICTED: acidic endochitinase SP2-like [Polistes dominula]
MGVVDIDKIRGALLSMGYRPKESYLEAIIMETNHSLSNANEAVMFLAQTAHETGGFRYIEEIAYAGTDEIAYEYGWGAPGKSYHGRGFIQLSWPGNYEQASLSLGYGYKLYENPELVSKNVKLAAKISMWYWKTKVRPVAGDMSKFGLTTKAINGALECRGQNVDKSKNRYRIYKALARELGIRNMSSECGCYN